MFNYVKYLVIIAVVIATWMVVGSNKLNTAIPRLDNMTIFNIGDSKLAVLVGEDRIIIQPFEYDNSSQFKSFSLERDDYSRLFNSNDANRFISVELLGSSYDIPMLLIHNNYHDHGAYSVDYKLEVNPVTEEVKVVH